MNAWIKIQQRRMTSGRLSSPCRDMLGFSLVEVMVALTIGLVILVGLATIFAGSRSTYQTDEGLVHLQENGRFAIDYLNREVRMTGYFGCLHDTRNIVNNVKSGGGFTADFTKNVVGFEATGTAPGETFNIASANPAPSATASDWTPALDATLQKRVIQGTDVLVIRRAGDDDIRLVSPYNDSAQVFLESGAGLEAGDNLVVTDCSKASVFQATAVSSGASKTNVAHAANANACANWSSGGAAGCPRNSQQYRDGAELFKATTMVFYVGQGSAGGPALFIARANGGKFDFEEIADGVESMQVLYGVDTTAPSSSPLDYADRYLTAKQVNTLYAADPLTGWPRVMSVRVSLVVRTVNVSGQADQIVNKDTYVAGGTIINPADDRRLRRVFNTTIQLRNRIPG